jgi:transcriptional regulator with XRE-family HTH domain
MPQDPNNVGQFPLRLLFIRLSTGYTQEAFANSLEVNLRTYQRFESGELLPRADFLYRLAKKFSLSLDYLFSSPRIDSFGGFLGLNAADQDVVAPLFLPASSEVARWRESETDPRLREILFGNLETSRGGCSAMHISTFKGAYHSPGFQETFGAEAFNAYGEVGRIEIFIDFWMAVLGSSYEAFLVSFPLETPKGKQDVVAFSKLIKDDLEKSVLFGSTYDLENRPDIVRFVREFVSTRMDSPSDFFVGGYGMEADEILSDGLCHRQGCQCGTCRSS